MKYKLAGTKHIEAWRNRTRFGPHAHMNSILVIGAFFLVSLPIAVGARRLCTTDAKFTYCKWGQIDNCQLLDEDLLASNSFTEEERDLIKAVRSRTLGSREFNIISLRKEFGSKVSRDESIPGVTMVVWTREDSHSNRKTLFGFTGENGVIQNASVRVPGKFAVDWCPVARELSR